MSKNKCLLGYKIGMSTFIDEEGAAVPVTLIYAPKNKVLKRKTKDSDGYESVLLGVGECKLDDLSKPIQGQLKGQESGWKQQVEFRVDADAEFEDTIDLTQFSVNDKLAVRSKTKGRGYSGTIKRWNFARGPMSHGSKSHRIPGSIGMSATPSKVQRGKKMAGRYGNTFITVKGLKVVAVDAEQEVLYVKGAVAGANHSLLRIVGAA